MNLQPLKAYVDPFLALISYVVVPIKVLAFLTQFVDGPMPFYTGLPLIGGILVSCYAAAISMGKIANTCSQWFFNKFEKGALAGTTTHAPTPVHPQENLPHNKKNVLSRFHQAAPIACSPFSNIIPSSTHFNGYSKAPLAGISQNRF